MGLRITVPRVDFESRAIGWTPAVPEGLQGLFFLNGTLEKAARNLVVGRASAAVIGSPVVGAGTVRMKGLANFLQTDIPEPTAFTILTVGACPDTMADDAHRGVFVSNFGSPPSGTPSAYGISMHVQTATRVVQTATRFTDAGSTTTTSGSNGSTVQNPANLSFMCGRARDDRTEMNNLTQALNTAANYPYPRYLSQGALRIGSAYSTFQGLSDIGFVAIYDRFITDAERDAMYAQVKAYFSLGFGLAI